MADRKTVNDVQMLDPKLVLDVKDRHGCLVTHSEKGWQLFSRPVDPDVGPFSYEVVTRATPEGSDRPSVDSLDQIPRDAVDVRDRHGDEISLFASSFYLWGYVREDLKKLNPIGDGPFTYEVPESATEAAPDAALMDRIVQAEKEDIRTQVARLTEELAELTGKIASANDVVDDRLTTLESSVSVLEDKIPGAVVKDDGYAKTGVPSTQFTLTEVPEGVNTVWDVDDDQAIHRLADGRWVFGLMPGGFPGGASGDTVDNPEHYTVTTVQP